MNKVDESKIKHQTVHVVLGLEDATMEQRIVFQSVVMPELLEVLDKYAGLLAMAPDVINITTKPVEKM